MNYTTLYIGGFFTTIGNLNVNYIASWDGNSWNGIDQNSLDNEGVNAISIIGNTIYIGGSFLANSICATDLAQVEFNSSTVENPPPTNKLFVPFIAREVTLVFAPIIKFFGNGDQEFPFQEAILLAEIDPPRW